MGVTKSFSEHILSKAYRFHGPSQPLERRAEIAPWLTFPWPGALRSTAFEDVGAEEIRDPSAMLPIIASKLLEACLLALHHSLLTCRALSKPP